MPLNWLANLQYPDIAGTALKDAAAKKEQLEGTAIEQKLNLMNSLGGAGGTGTGGENLLLKKLSVLDPQAAAAYLKVDDKLNPTPYSGDGFQNQLANVQMRAYIEAGYDPNEAARLAGSDVMKMKKEVYTDAMGNTRMVQSDALPEIAPREMELITEVATAPEKDRPAVYKRNLKLAKDEGMDTSGFPEELTPEWSNAILELYGTQKEQAAASASGIGGPVNLTRSDGSSVDNSVINSPKVKVAGAEETAKRSAIKIDEWKQEATAAADTLEDHRRVYEVYKSGFKGGPLAGFDMAKIKAKTQLGTPLTQEEQEYANNYSILESTAKINVAKTIKPIFGGNISDGERNFATDLQAAPLDIREQAIAKAAVQEAGALQKIRKVEMLDEWIQVYGSPDAKDRQGRSFDRFYSNFVDQNPILTSEFMSERGAVVPVKTVKQAEELKAGTRFIAPDGKIRVKK